MNLDYLIEFAGLKQRQVLEEIEHRFDLHQRTPGYICEAPKFFGTAPCYTFRKIQDNAIAGTTPLIRQIAFGWWQSIDEKARHNRKTSRVLVGLKVLEDHG